MMVIAPDFFRFTICGIPELGSHCEAGVTHVLSILDPEWPDPPEFEDYAPHRRMALRFHDIIDPLPGRIAPTRDDVERLLAFGHELSDAETCHLLVHCHAGVSRSTAATALILAQAHPERSGPRRVRRGIAACGRAPGPICGFSNSATSCSDAAARSSPPPARSTAACSTASPPCRRR